MSNSIEFLAGAAGGLAGTVSGYPFDTVKVRQQCAPEPIPLRHCIRQIYGELGLCGFYRGITTPMLFSTPMTATAFFGYNHANRHLSIVSDGAAKKILCGMLGGACAAQISCPTERLKCIMQSNKEIESPVAALRYILHHEGITGLHRGMAFTLTRDMCAYGAFFATLHSSRPVLGEILTNKTVIDMIIGALAGSAFWLAALPGDRLKSTIQSDLEGRYTSPRQLAQSVWRAEGARGLYRGLAPTMMRAVPSNAIMFIAYERTRLFLSS